MPNMKLDTPEDVLREVRAIFEADSGDLANFLYQQLIINALKCKRDELGLLDLKVINRALAEFRYAARVFKPYKNIRKVSVFGSARTPPEDPYYRLAVKFSRMLVEHGYMVITGAGNGIMKAGNEGAGKDKSFGVNILLPFEQAPNEFILDDPKLITFRFFFTRKIFFLMEAHAVALFPGGFGTHDEVFETLTLLQTGKNPPMPLLLMELPGEHYWESWDHFVRDQMLARGLISEEDLSLYKIAQSAEEGVAWIRSYYSTYHSMRQVRDKLVLRLERELDREHIEELNTSFSDLIREGQISKTPPLPPERDEPNLLSKPRIAFSYNGISAGRLTQMILKINQLGASAGAA